MAIVNPEALQEEAGLYFLRTKLGQAKGLFLADVPSNWDRFLDVKNQGQRKKVEVLLQRLINSQAFVRVGNFPWSGADWTSFAMSARGTVQTKFRVGFMVSQRTEGLFIGVDDGVDVEPRTSIMSPNLQELIEFIKLHISFSGRVAFVDRHNELLTYDGSPSGFAVFLKSLLEAIKGFSCHEVRIYSLVKGVSPSTARSYQARVSGFLGDFIPKALVPTKGIHFFGFLSDQTGGRNSDLHTRHIVTNHVAFILGDSISVRRRKSQVITIAPIDSKSLEHLQRLWLDGEHGLETVLRCSLLR